MGTRAERRFEYSAGNFYPFPPHPILGDRREQLGPRPVAISGLVKTNVATSEGPLYYLEFLRDGVSSPRLAPFSSEKAGPRLTIEVDSQSSNFAACSHFPSAFVN